MATTGYDLVVEAMRHPFHLALVTVFFLISTTILILRNVGSREPIRRPAFIHAEPQHVSSLPQSVFNSTESEPLFYPPLSTKGRYIVDANGTRFKLASVNWYGGSDELFVPSGLDIRHRDEIAETIREMGFNSVRLPYSDEMVMSNPIIPSHLLAANKDLLTFSEGGNSQVRALDVFEAVVNALTKAGLAIIPNDHITQATWCCGANPCDAAWFNDQFGSLCRVSLSEEQWVRNWETVMRPHIHNPLVIGPDLRNEVRGTWGTMPWSSWRRAAELAGNRLHTMNPNWLIFVSGTGSSNLLQHVGEDPVGLTVENKVVYEAHVYSWSGWGTLAGMYGKRKSYESFRDSMRRNWGYLLEQDIAPVWVGEFGSGDNAGPMDRQYWNYLMKWLRECDADWGYWAMNPRKPRDEERESYGLIRDDWQSVVEDYRLEDLRKIISCRSQPSN